jgi:predicted nucleic acid-binding protein
MPNYFFDTSALAKGYHTEAGTGFVLRIVFEPKAERWVSLLSIVEMESVFARKIRATAIHPTELMIARRSLQADLAQDRFRTCPALLNRHYHRAQDLVARHGVREGLRTLDALQLALAVELQQSGTIDLFLAADQKLCRVASLEGLAVINPEAPGPLLVTP